ncbi:MAG TPA: AAC(3) family N-acetyltransferase, partial [Vicinamibacterales bacterium]|nr:AAC(3) family N-acetyltransferase [Vicinamibacterales bacterium]
MRSRGELARDFTSLGIQPGDTLMVHASVRAVGPIAGGPDQIHLALKDALTDAGTLMMYAGCPIGYDDVGRGQLRALEERAVIAKQPPFDAVTARAAREHGVLVEFFRSFPGSLVNNHVARFVVWGREARYLISKQPWNYAFGKDSALERFVELNGKILLLGCDHDNVTFLHYAEHIVDIPDKRIARFEVPVLENGERVWKEMEEFDTATPCHARFPDRFFAQIVNRQLSRTRNRGGRVGHAHSFLIDAKGLLELALVEMRHAAAGVGETWQPRIV